MEMTSVTVGIASVVAIVIAIYSGVHIAIALGLISFVGVVILKNADISFSLLSLAIASESRLNEISAFLRMTTPTKEIRPSAMAMCTPE